MQPNDAEPHFVVEPDDGKPAPDFDVVGVGNAIVDCLAAATDEFIEGQGLDKGSMLLIDETRALELDALIGDAIKASGGSAANTMAGVASFGGRAAYVGKINDDDLGRFFAKDMNSVGVDFGQKPAVDGPATGRCVVLVTPDAQRTMSTYLGVSALLEPDDVDGSLIERASFLFCEGYLWDVDSAKAAIRKAMEVARAKGRKVAFTASDAFCVERHHQEFLELVNGPIDVLFANEAELTRLYECDFDNAVARVAQDVELAFVTRGAKGSLVVTAQDTIEVPAIEVPVVDTTGAGDQYAAGALYGLAKGLSLAEAGRLGTVAASEVISHMGPRPERPLSELI